MNRHLLKGVLLFSTGSLLLACSDDNSPFGSGASGKLNPTVVVDSSLKSGSRAESSAMDISTNQLLLTLTPNGWDGTPFSHTGVDDFPTDHEFIVGNYIFEASYGSLDDEGFEKPYYYGSTAVTVEENITTPVALTVTLANSMVSITFDESLTSYASDLSASVITRGATITFDPSEDRPAYMQPGTAVVTLALTKPNGVAGTVTIPTFEAKAQYHHHVNLALAGGSDQATLEVTFDSDTEADDIDIDLSDQLLNSPAPVATPNGFTSGEAVAFVPGLSLAADLSVDIIAQASIASVMIETDSPSLIEAGWPASVDLIAATSGQQTTLRNLGLSAEGIFHNPERMAVIDFTGITKHIDAADDNTAITLTVFDKAGKASDPVKLILAPDELLLSIEAITTLFPEQPGMPVELRLNYNGNDPQNELTFQYKNRLGAWTALKPLSIDSEGDTSFKVSLPAPDIDFSLELRAVCTPLSTDRNTVASNTITIAQLPYRLKAFDGDIFATSATLRLSGSTLTASQLAAIAQSGSLEITPEGTTITVNGAEFQISGLQPNTPYTAKFSYDGDECPIVTFTTEQALSLANSAMEDWSKTTKSSSDVWTCTDWATLNPLTTNYTSTSTKYSTVSSTIRETGRSGYCAMLRSVGYDVPNSTQSSLLGTSNEPNRYSAGELFLGDYSVDDGATYGIDFSSRPSALSFWYKYTPANGSADCGYAEITLFDADGAVIATQTADLEAVSDFTEKTLTVSYPAGAPKAAKISVLFRSTNAGTTYFGLTYMPKKTSGLLSTLSDYYVGSMLYIDDIQLTY